MSQFNVDEKSRNIHFQAGCSLAFSLSLLLLLFWTQHIFLLGKYSFQPYILLIVGQLCLTHFLAGKYYHTPTVTIGKKNDHLKSVKSPKISIYTRVLEFIKISIFLLAIVLFYFIVSVLFGAEILSKHEETFMFSTLLAILTALPIALNSGCNSFMEIVTGVKPTTIHEAYVARNLLVTLAGAWCGAFAIPLDWDQPWQEWPIPCSIGALIGFMVSQVIIIQRKFGWNTKKSIV